MKNQKNQLKGKSAVRTILCLIVLIAIVVYVCVSCSNKDCEKCHGEKICWECCHMGDRPGICWICEGEGYSEGENHWPCSFCDGTGICGTCMGSGKCDHCGGSGKEP